MLRCYCRLLKSARAHCCSHAGPSPLSQLISAFISDAGIKAELAKPQSVDAFIQTPAVKSFLTANKDLISKVVSDPATRSGLQSLGQLAATALGSLEAAANASPTVILAQVLPLNLPPVHLTYVYHVPMLACTIHSFRKYFNATPVAMSWF